MKKTILQPLNIGPLSIVTGYRPKTAREGASHVWDRGDPNRHCHSFTTLKETSVLKVL